MNQKWLYSEIVLIFAGLILNQLSLMILNFPDPIIPGVQPHSRPPIVGSGFLFLIPLGIISIVRHFVLKSKMGSNIVSPFDPL